MSELRSFRVGTGVEDRCAACKTARRHTVTAVAGDVVRVICDYCGSQHQYRGGPGDARPPAGTAVASRERREAPLDPSTAGAEDLERLLRRVVREELGLTPGRMAARWAGGDLVLRPGRPGLQERAWPIDTFFHKIVMVRNRLRVLEQQINGAEIPEALKVRLQGYVTGCYGTLTSFNVLFEEEGDRFRGSGGED